MKLEKLKYLKHYTLIKIVAPKKTLPLKIGVIWTFAMKFQR